VAPGDAVGKTDARLLMRSAAASGVLLQPSEPATPIDAALVAGANGTPLGHVWLARTFLGERTYATLFAAGVTRPLALAAADLGYPTGSVLAMETSCDAPEGRACDVVAGLAPIQRMNAAAFRVWSVAPVEAGGHWTLLGEVHKWVAVSAARVASVSTADDLLLVSVLGTVGEAVTLAFAPPGAAEEAARAEERDETSARGVAGRVRAHVLTCTLAAAEARVSCARARPTCRCA
jgi:hypothetical protein